MSGYPYGNPMGGGYPPNYNPGYPSYPGQPAYQSPPPPPVPVYGNNPPYPSPYGSSAAPMHGSGPFSASPYPPNLMPGNQYHHGSSMAPYPPAGGSMPTPSQSHRGVYQHPPASTHNSGSLYPNLSGSSNYNAHGGGGATNASVAIPSPSYPQPVYPQEQQSILLASLEQHQGTVYPIGAFNPESDCQALSNAMKGVGTNERVLIDIIANRSNSQRQQIKLNYKSMFGQDLIKQISGELSGNFRETVTALFDPPADYDAWSLNQALNGMKQGTLREILLTRTNSEIRAIIGAFHRLYKKSLEKEINSRVSGKDFKRLLVSAVQADREELSSQQIQQARQMGIESVVDRNRARQDAEELYKAGEGKLGTDEKKFNAIFSRRSYHHLRAVFEEYQRKYGKDITHAIRSEFSGDTKEAYLVLISCIRDRPTFFAERLNKAMVGLGTRDSTLIRVIVTRSEIDLAQIKDRYRQMYSHSLADDIRGDTSGDYKRLLLAIVK